MSSASSLTSSSLCQALPLPHMRSAKKSSSMLPASAVPVGGGDDMEDNSGGCPGGISAVAASTGSGKPSKRSPSSSPQPFVMPTAGAVGSVFSIWSSGSNTSQPEVTSSGGRGGCWLSTPSRRSATSLSMKPEKAAPRPPRKLPMRFMSRRCCSGSSGRSLVTSTLAGRSAAGGWASSSLVAGTGFPLTEFDETPVVRSL
mmetsp:Transcript_54211/g.84357  ORF Transcript_54211/g.84357 Transcript_54211/m.84357 type:complete len:200 (-) Transcript_54211:1368-1967(-)